MTPGIVAMLLGLFGVPAVLLWAGHRMRRRSPRWRATFWGALVAHVAVVPLVLWASMYPAADWAPLDRLRGALGFWAMLVAPAIGALVGRLRAGASRGDDSAPGAADS